MPSTDLNAKKPDLTPELRTLWLRLRSAWNMNFTAFSNSVSALNERQANLLYDVVKLSLYKSSYVDIMRGNPWLKPILISDEDRLCMMDIYEVLSWRLNRKEPFPPDVELSMKVKRKIGREDNTL